MLSIRKWVHMAITAFGAAYLTFVFLIKALIKNIEYHSVYLQKEPPVLLYLLLDCGAFLLFYFLLHLLSRCQLILFRHEKTRKRLSPRIFAITALCSFAFYLCYLIACHPGGFSPDTSWQWEQAHTMVFNDHHPAFHTLLFWLLTRIWDNYTFMLLIQIAAFACGMGYLAATMLAWGFRRRLVAPMCAVLLLTTPTRYLMMYFWKDSTLSVFFLFLIPHFFNILLSGGEWLQKRSHWLSFALLLALITLVRHNSILITAPLLALMFACVPDVRKVCLKVTAVFLLLVLGVKGPLYQYFNVETTKTTYLETTGLPMTILCSSYVLSPETMPAEAYQFMERLEDPQTAAANYDFGDFNSIKWGWEWDYQQANDIISQTPFAAFLRLTWETMRGNALLSISSVLELTDMVWDPWGRHYDLAPLPDGRVPKAISIPEELSQCFDAAFRQLDRVLSVQIFQRPTSQLGILILLMLLSCYVSLHQAHGWASIWLVLPIMCYNFGTMLLLCGQDFRFFHFNCLVTYPLMVLLLSKPRESGNEPCKS